MNKKNKGFTLIELLAIIVILAIIAVITVPIILNVIDNAKRGTAQDSAYGYKDAISKYYVTEMFNNNNITLNGDYTVDSNGVLSNETERHEILFSGTKPKGGHLTYLNNVLINGCLTIDDYKVVFSDGETTNVERGKCDSTPTETTYKCKRAELSTLHQEECTQTSGSCYDAGYIEDNKGATITYGNKEVIKGTLTSGDAFDCDVNGDREYNPQTERFYYVSDLYNTTTKQYDDDYAVLIYYNNFYNKLPNNTNLSLVTYHSENINYEGPIQAIKNLPTTTIWKNVGLSNTSRKILNHKGDNTSNNGLNTLPDPFSYEGYAARLLTFQEVAQACGGDGNPSSAGELDTCNFLMENTKYSNSSIEIYGYWLENPHKDNSENVRSVYGNCRCANSGNAANSVYYGVRPAIEVLKTDIEY